MKFLPFLHKILTRASFIVLLLMLSSNLCIALDEPTQIKPILIKGKDYGVLFIESKIYFDLQEEYSQDRVAIYIDGEGIYNNTVSTPNDGAGFTDAINIEKYGRSGFHILVFINGKGWMANINLKNGQFIGIEYDSPNGNIRLKQSIYPFIYD